MHIYTYIHTYIHTLHTYIHTYVCLILIHWLVYSLSLHDVFLIIFLQLRKIYEVYNIYMFIYIRKQMLLGNYYSYTQSYEMRYFTTHNVLICNDDFDRITTSKTPTKLLIKEYMTIYNTMKKTYACCIKGVIKRHVRQKIECISFDINIVQSK